MLTLRSFAYILQNEIDPTLMYDTATALGDLDKYFRMFNKQESDEVLQWSFIHTLTHYQEELGAMKPYLKSLARGKSKTNESEEEVSVDFLEDTYADGDDTLEVNDTGNNNVMHASNSDFSVDLIDRLDAEVHAERDIIEFALNYLDRFLILCEAIERKDTTTLYYPENFIRDCLRLSGRYLDFNKQCLGIYNKYGDEIKWFLKLEEEFRSDRGTTWREAEFTTVANKQSKRVKMVHKVTGAEVINADHEQWVISGKLSTDKNEKRVLRVNYEDLFDTLCFMADDLESNEIKFVIGDSCLIRTLGGSVQYNPDMFDIYELIKQEIVTNVLLETGCRLLNVGSECIYLLKEDNKPIELKDRTVKGIEIKFEIEDITSEVELQ